MVTPTQQILVKMGIYGQITTGSVPGKYGATVNNLPGYPRTGTFQNINYQQVRAILAAYNQAVKGQSQGLPAPAAPVQGQPVSLIPHRRTAEEGRKAPTEEEQAKRAQWLADHAKVQQENLRNYIGFRGQGPKETHTYNPPNAAQIADALVKTQEYSYNPPNAAQIADALVKTQEYWAQQALLPVTHVWTGADTQNALKLGYSQAQIAQWELLYGKGFNDFSGQDLKTVAAGGSNLLTTAPGWWYTGYALPDVISFYQTSKPAYTSPLGDTVTGKVPGFSWFNWTPGKAPTVGYQPIAGYNFDLTKLSQAQLILLGSPQVPKGFSATAVYNSATQKFDTKTSFDPAQLGNNPVTGKPFTLTDFTTGQGVDVKYLPSSFMSTLGYTNVPAGSTLQYLSDGNFGLWSPAGTTSQKATLNPNAEDLTLVGGKAVLVGGGGVVGSGGVTTPIYTVSNSLFQITDANKNQFTSGNVHVGDWVVAAYGQGGKLQYYNFGSGTDAKTSAQTWQTAAWTVDTAHDPLAYAQSGGAYNTAMYNLIMAGHEQGAPIAPTPDYIAPTPDYFAPTITNSLPTFNVATGQIYAVGTKFNLPILNTDVAFKLPTVTSTQPTYNLATGQITKAGTPMAPSVTFGMIGTMIQGGAEAGAILGTLFVAPELLPVTVPQIVTGIAANIGISEVVSKFGPDWMGGSGQFLGPEQIMQTAAQGALFIGGSAVVFKGLSMAGNVGKNIVQSIIGRTAVNTMLGASVNYVTSGFNIQAAEEGALFGLTFSLGGEGLGKLNLKAGYADIKIPLEEGVTVTNLSDVTKFAEWKGLYLGRGENVGHLGVLSGVTEEDTIFANKVLPGGKEVEGYKPVTPIEAKVTIDVMGKAGYGSAIKDITDIRKIMSYVKGTSSEYVTKFPESTSTLSAKGVDVLKDFVKGNADVHEVYGSFSAMAQQYLVRAPGDIDIMLKVSTPEEAVKFANDLVERLKVAGEDVRVNPEKPTLIEANVGGGKYAHAVDIHFMGEPSTGVPTEGSWGYNYTQKVTYVEELPTMRLSEQTLRKFGSMLGFQEDKTIGPVAHRMGDIADAFVASRTLIESKTIPSGKITGIWEEQFGKYVPQGLGEEWSLKPEFENLRVPLEWGKPIAPDINVVPLVVTGGGVKAPQVVAVTPQGQVSIKSETVTAEEKAYNEKALQNILGVSQEEYVLGKSLEGFGEKVVTEAPTKPVSTPIETPSPDIGYALGRLSNPIMSMAVPEYNLRSVMIGYGIKTSLPTSKGTPKKSTLRSTYSPSKLFESSVLPILPSPVKSIKSPKPIYAPKTVKPIATPKPIGVPTTVTGLGLSVSLSLKTSSGLVYPPPSPPSKPSSKPGGGISAPTKQSTPPLKHEDQILKKMPRLIDWEHYKMKHYIGDIFGAPSKTGGGVDSLLGIKTTKPKSKPKGEKKR